MALRRPSGDDGNVLHTQGGGADPRGRRGRRPDYGRRTAGQCQHQLFRHQPAEIPAGFPVHPACQPGRGRRDGDRAAPLRQQQPGPAVGTALHGQDQLSVREPGHRSVPGRHGRGRAGHADHPVAVQPVQQQRALEVAAGFPAIKNPLQSQVAGSSGFCLDEPGASSQDGLAMQLFTCNGTSAQQWDITGPAPS